MYPPGLVVIRPWRGRGSNCHRRVALQARRWRSCQAVGEITGQSAACIRNFMPDASSSRAGIDTEGSFLQVSYWETGGLGESSALSTDGPGRARPDRRSSGVGDNMYHKGVYPFTDQF